MTDDLVARLKAGLDADEAVAQGAARTDDGHGGHWLPVHFGSGGFDARVDDHIARQAPARTLREVAAKRAILARHSPVKPGTEVACAWCSDDLGAADFHMAWPCPDVLALAAVYSDDAT